MDYKELARKAIERSKKVDLEAVTVHTPAYFRTCQACGKTTPSEPPAPHKELSSAFIMRKCPFCNSEALDYGTYESSPEYTIRCDEHFYAAGNVEEIWSKDYNEARLFKSQGTANAVVKELCESSPEYFQEHPLVIEEA